MTTTGFASTDFATWPVLASMTLVGLMFVGGSAGSTSGSVKVVRHLLLGKILRREVDQTVHPEVVLPVRLNRRVVDERTLRAVSSFVLLYIGIFVVGATLLAVDAARTGLELSAFDAIAAAATTLGNIGPGFGVAGPYGSFEPFSDFSTVVMVGLMWLGRLEVIPIVVLASPPLLADRANAALALEEDALELVLLARLEHREHLIPGTQHRPILGELRAAVPHHGDQPRTGGQVEPGEPLARRGRVAVDLELDDLEVLLAELEQVDDPVLGNLVLDEAEDVRGGADGLRDPEQVEVLLVARIVHPGDDLRDAIALARELADDQVVLVVAGRGQDEVGRPADPGQLEHVQLGRVAELHLVLELLLELLEARRSLLDQRHLVPHPQERAGDVRPDFAASRDDRVHQSERLLGDPDRGGLAELRDRGLGGGQTVSIPRLA